MFTGHIKYLKKKLGRYAFLFFVVLFNQICFADEIKIYSYNQSSKTCEGFNLFLGECFANEKLSYFMGKFDSLNLNGSKMRFFRIHGSHIKELKFDDVLFNSGSITNTKIDHLTSARSNFIGTVMKTSSFRKFSFTSTQFTAAKISNVVFEDGAFHDSLFKDAMITDSIFRRVLLPKSILKEAEFINVQFIDVQWL